MIALLWTHLAGMGVFLTVPVLAPAIAAELGIAASLAGVHTALVYLGAMVSGPLAEAFIHRFGGIRVLQAGMLISAFGIALAMLGHPAAFCLGGDCRARPWAGHASRQPFARSPHPGAAAGPHL